MIIPRVVIIFLFAHSHTHTTLIKMFDKVNVMLHVHRNHKAY